MIGLTYDPIHTATRAYRRPPLKPIDDIPREEMLKRNSFQSVNENKFLTAWLNQRSKK
ncbi:DUF2737 family protein [Enterobacter ludwigii]|uniref:DUF2737 family protein n=1 Tax=Enterobacter ludwigii TaxID=299767 RepID=UPI001BA5EF11|nr:DUF2737 family protein [Enterobacter ludwigii]MBS0870704.1 DUF2737 family protein [Enterobacter ludwigii]